MLRGEDFYRKAPSQSRQARESPLSISHVNGRSNGKLAFKEVQRHIPQLFMLDSPSKIKNYPCSADGMRGTGEIDLIKAQELIQRYRAQKIDLKNAKEQLHDIINRKQAEMQSMIVFRDKITIISMQKSHTKELRISLQRFKQKAKITVEGKDLLRNYRQEITELSDQIQLMQQYRKYISEQNISDEIVIEIYGQERLMKNNMEQQIQHLFKTVNDEKKRNAKEIKYMQDSIMNLRVSIKKKQDQLREIKSKLCTLHIKMYQGTPNSRSKKISLSIRKFNTEKHTKLEEAFIGNANFKSYSRQCLEKVEQGNQLNYIRFFTSKQPQKDKLESVGKIHNLGAISTDNNSENNNGELRMHEIQVRDILSIKFYFKSKIVGVECRVKSQRGNKNLMFGNCSPNIQHQLLTIVHKKLITISSFWQCNEMIGISMWYTQQPITRKIYKSVHKRELVREQYYN